MAGIAEVQPQYGIAPPNQLELATYFAAHPEAENMAQLVDGVAADQAAVAAARGASARNLVNKVARVLDFFPTIIDPTTVLEITALTAKSFNAIPQHRLDRMRGVGRLVSRIARLDPVPDVPADTVIDNFLLELGTQVVPSWYRTSKHQIKLDNERRLAAKEAQRRLEGAQRSGWLAVAQEWQPYVAAHRSVMAAQQSALPLS